MAVKQSQAGVLRREVHLGFLISTDHDDILHNTRRRYSRDLSELEIMPVKMDGMNIIAGISHAEAVAPALPQMEGGGDDSLRHGIGPSINRPSVKTPFGGVVLGKHHLECLVRRRSGGTSFGKTRVVPREALRRDPNRLCLMSRVLHYNTHTVRAIVMREITHDPNTWTVHLDNRRNAFRRSEPEHRDLGGR